MMSNKPKKKPEKMAALFKEMSFYLEDSVEPGLGQLIEKHGGHVLSEPMKSCQVVVGPTNKNTTKYPNVITQDFVHDTIEKGSLPSKKKYTLSKPVKASDVKINLPKVYQDSVDNGTLLIDGETFLSTGSKKSNKFTQAEDDLILDLVRRNPHLRSTHSFFERISILPPLSGHTGNSIRFRFRKTLDRDLKYYYLVDPLTNELKLDPKTEEPIKVYETPALMKSQYTAEEDFLLCKSVLDYIYGRSFPHIKRKRISTAVPVMVYQSVSNQMPTHSTLSYRDRYRKFASKYGLQKYVDYYEKCVEEGREPLPMKNLSSRADRKDVPRQKLSEETVNDGDEEIEINQYEQELAQHQQNKSTDEPLRKKLKLDTSKINGSDHDTSVDVAAAAIAKVTEISQKKKKSKKKSKKDQVESSGEQTAGTNLFEEGLADISKGELVGNVDGVEDDVAEMREDEGLMDFRQLVEIDPEPLKNRASNPNITQIIDNVTKCFDSFIDGTPYELFKDLSDCTGISMLWLTYWFDCSCGMLQTFNDAINHYLQSGELILENSSGFWTEKDDELLKKDPNNLYLLELHGEESVEKRKTVLF